MTETVRVGSDLTMVIRSAGDTYSIGCSGELDLVSSERLRREIEQAVACRPRALELDCSQVSFIDSMGVRAILYASRSCRSSTIDFRLTLNEVVGRLFDTLGLSSAVVGGQVIKLRYHHQSHMH